MDDQADIRRIIQELGVLSNPVQPSEQRSRAQAEYNAAEERYSNEVDPARKRALVFELARCEEHLREIENQEQVKEELLQKQLYRLLSKRHGESAPSVQQRSEQPEEDATRATPSTITADTNTGLDNDQATNLIMEPNHQQRAITTSPLEPRTIRFDEVQREQCSGRIIERQGNYYIFKCEEHFKVFDGLNPLRSASIHLREHNGLPTDYKSTFKYLGYRVVDCNEARRRENQTKVDRFLEEQTYKVQRDKASIYDLDGYPQPGKVYMVWWDGWDDEGRYRLQAVLVLRFSDAKNSELGNKTPVCYENNGGDYGWAEDYKDGQRKAKGRKYPVMCFDGKAQHQLVWLEEKEFRQLNLQDEHFEYRQDVQDYLVSHPDAATGPMNEIDDESDDLYDDSRNGDVDERSETLDFGGGDQTGTTTEIAENHR